MRGGIRWARGLGGGCVVLLLVLAATLPATAQAGCGGVQIAFPSHRHHGQRPPLAIGDSTMLLALQNLTSAGYEVNAHGCREWGEAMALLRAGKAAGTLPHMVVIALGADGSITRADVGQALGLLCCTRLLVLVTPRELGGGSGSDAVTVRQEVFKHHNRAKVLDWVRYSAGRGGWFQPDGLHLTYSGAAAFTRLLKQALPWAYPTPKPKHKHALFTSALRGRATPSTASAAGLAIRPSLAHTGYVTATVTGPPGAGVQLSEQDPGQTRLLTTVTLSNGGSAAVSDVLTWRCDLRQRRLVATTLSPAAPAQTAITVTTPACTRRLSARIVKTSGTGPGLEVRVRDRWGLGAVGFSVCVTAPGGSSRCRPWQLAAGTPARQVEVPAPRPGDWQATLRTPYERPVSRDFWIADHPGPLRVLAAGDSEMQEVDDFLRQDLGPHGIRVTSDARISTGLTNSFFFDWQAHARAQAASLRPDVTIMFMGGNEGFPLRDARGRLVGCCGGAWSAGYASLVARMMQTYLRGQAARVYWFLLPAPRERRFQRLFDAVNSGIRRAAARFPGRAGLIDANAFFTPRDHYRDFMTYHGHGLAIHYSDGVHLATTANAIAASLVVKRLRADRVIR
jgi:hypothetical protein